MIAIHDVCMNHSTHINDEVLDIEWIGVGVEGGPQSSYICSLPVGWCIDLEDIAHHLCVNIGFYIDFVVIVVTKWNRYKTPIFSSHGRGVQKAVLQNTYLQ